MRSLSNLRRVKVKTKCLPDPSFDNAAAEVTDAPPLKRFLFTAEEVAQSLAISTTMVRQLTLCGDIPCRRMGRLVRYSIEDVEAFVHDLDERRYQSPASR